MKSFVRLALAFEPIFGNILAGILILIIVISVLFSIFSLLFRDGHGLGLYGNRGNFYMEE